MRSRAMEKSMVRTDEAASKPRMQYRGLRGWLEHVEKMGELRRVDGAHWDVEMGAITHGLPLEYERKVDVVRTYHARMQNLKPLPPRFVNNGPVLENVIEGDSVDVLKFPVPRHHELDKARFIG